MSSDEDAVDHIEEKLREGEGLTKAELIQRIDTEDEHEIIGIMRSDVNPYVPGEPGALYNGTYYRLSEEPLQNTENLCTCGKTLNDEDVDPHLQQHGGGNL